jgi:hypothetical protein
MRRVAATCLACIALGSTACGDSGSDNGAATTTAPAPTTTAPASRARVLAGPIGVGAACQDRLAKTVTVEYLRQRGIGIANEQAAQSQLSSAIVKVCQEGPDSRQVAAAAERVVQVINEEFLPPEQ